MKETHHNTRAHVQLQLVFLNTCVFFPFQSLDTLHSHTFCPPLPNANQRHWARHSTHEEGPAHSLRLGQDEACRQKGLEVHVGLQEAGGLGFVSVKRTRVQHSDKTHDSATGTQWFHSGLSICVVDRHSALKAFPRGDTGPRKRIRSDPEGRKVSGPTQACSTEEMNRTVSRRPTLWPGLASQSWVEMEDHKHSATSALFLRVSHVAQFDLELPM